MKLLIIQFSPASCYANSLKPNFSVHHPFLKHPRVLRLGWDTKFHTHKSSRER